MTKKPKVFCIGFQKTGTSSMRDALRRLDFRVQGVYGLDKNLAELRATYIERCLALAADFDAVEDMPWPLLFRELDRAYPGSKFILTLRDTDSWYGSILSHLGPAKSPMQQLIYGDDAPTPSGHEERYRNVYEAHNRAVLEYFAARPSDLLVMHLEQGDGWPELGEFLNVPVPDGPFIKTNTSAQRRSFLGRVRKKLIKMGVPVPAMDG